MPLTIKYDENEFAQVILDQARYVSEGVMGSFDITNSPARQVWFNLATFRGVGLTCRPWRIQAWEGDPTNADLLEEVTCGVRDVCAAMEYLCSDIIRGIRVIDGGSALVAENIVEAVVKQNPRYLTEETCDAIVQMIVYGAILHK
tara:strand:- start:530 stop:964 length:435 start_codon:yes stop_codon:yes gene_type:complete